MKNSRVVIALQALRERPSAAALHAVENDVSGGLNNKALEIWRVKPGLLVYASRLTAFGKGLRPEFANHRRVTFSCVFAYVLIRAFSAEVPGAALVGVAVF